jgi:hypothetical protein
MRLASLYVVTVAFFNYLLVSGSAVSRPPWIVGFLLVAVAFVVTLREGRIPRPGPFGLAIMVFALTTILNGLVVWVNPALSWHDYIRSEVQFLFAFSVVYAFARARFNEHQIAKLMHVWVWTAGVAALYAIYQSIARVLGLPFSELTIQAKGFSEMLVKRFFGFSAASSWFAEPSWLGSFLVAPLLYLIGVMLFEAVWPIGFRAWIGRLLLGVIGLALFLSLSQAAYATILVVFLPLLWQLRGRLRFGQTLAWTAGGMVMVFATVLLLTQRGADVIRAQRERLTAIIEALRAPETASLVTSFGVRLQDMRAGVLLWESSPLVGVGINSVRYDERARLLTDPESGSVDSGVLQLLAEQGLLGFGAFCLAVIVLWHRLQRARARQSDAGTRFVLWFLTWALLAEVVNSVFTHPWQHPQRWLVIAFGASLLTQLERREVSVTNPA